ncbi:MAG: ribonuclease III [Candidatus Puniceispirillaceae bacterium]
MTSEPPVLFAKLQDQIGYQFKDISLLQAALTHKSAPASQHGDYERLEFLGDRILGLEISHALYSHFSQDDQGDLTKRFHALVQQNALVEIAKTLNLSSLIVTDATRQAAKQASVMADVVEALIAAIFLDGGIDEARRFIFSHLDITATSSDDGMANPKSALQEWAMARRWALPSYEVVSVEGPDHAPTFVCEVMIADIGTMRASGASKKIAEQNAARHLLQELQKKESL